MEGPSAGRSFPLSQPSVYTGLLLKRAALREVAPVNDAAIQSVPWVNHVSASFPGFVFIGYAAQGLLYYSDKASPAVSNLLISIIVLGAVSVVVTLTYTIIQNLNSGTINGNLKDVITILQVINNFLIAAMGLISSILFKFYLENGISSA